MPRPIAELFLDSEAIEAANVQEAAMKAVREARAELGLTIDPDTDSNMTGLIGAAYTGMTTTLGKLESKRSAASPEAAALLVRLLRDAGVGPASVVAINSSGSFPGFALASVAACGALGAEARIVLSLGASSWGANIPELNVAEMMLAAIERGAYPPGYRFSVKGVSPGGSDDQGLDIEPEILETMLSRLSAKGVRILSPHSLEESVALRLEAYDGLGQSQVLLNIGGNYAASGASVDLSLLSGIVLPTEYPGISGVGLTQSFLRQGKPVIQLLNVERLFSDRNLSFDAPASDRRNARSLYRRSSIALAALASLPAFVALLVFAHKERPSAGKNI